MKWAVLLNLVIHVKHSCDFFILPFARKLPSQFPHEKPSVRISPGGKHPWLDDRVSQLIIVGH